MIKFQLIVADGQELLFLKTFWTKKEAINYYKKELIKKYPLGDFQIYYRKENFLP